LNRHGTLLGSLRTLLMQEICHSPDVTHREGFLGQVELFPELWRLAIAAPGAFQQLSGIASENPRCRVDLAMNCFSDSDWVRGHS
jgi:hypothetical protein